MKKSNFREEARQFVVENARTIVLALMLIIVVGALGAGELLNAYELFWWWDDMLHTLAGFVLGVVGFLLTYLFHRRAKTAISPLMVAGFTFAFSISACVLWEIFEFTADTLLGTNMQRWQMPPDAVLIGKDYQGSGLRDTMSDLIVGWGGATVAASLAYLAFKHRREASLGFMRRALSWLERK